MKHKSDMALEVGNLDKTFVLSSGWLKPSIELKAVRGVSLSLRAGQTLGVVGESGCGKSTLSRMISGSIAPTSGSIHIGGKTVVPAGRSEARTALSQVQMVFQSPSSSLNPRMKMLDIVREPLDIHQRGTPLRERQEKAIETLELVGLRKEFSDRYPSQLSGGQQQRVGIARAIIRPISLLLCDEPVSALDVSVQAQVVNLLRDMQHRLGIAYLFVSHDLAVVANMSHEIAVMYLGRIVEQAPTAELIGSPRHPYTRALLDSVDIPDPTAERKRTRVALKGDLPNPANPPSGCAFRTRCPLADLRCEVEDPALTIGNGAHAVACHHA